LTNELGLSLGESDMRPSKREAFAILPIAIQRWAVDHKGHRASALEGVGRRDTSLLFEQATAAHPNAPLS
jgi:hypothetical protein